MKLFKKRRQTTSSFSVTSGSDVFSLRCRSAVLQILNYLTCKGYRFGPVCIELNRSRTEMAYVFWMNGNSRGEITLYVSVYAEGLSRNELLDLFMHELLHVVANEPLHSGRWKELMLKYKVPDDMYYFNGHTLQRVGALGGTFKN